MSLFPSFPLAGGDDGASGVGEGGGEAASSELMIGDIGSSLPALWLVGDVTS